MTEQNLPSFKEINPAVLAVVVVVVVGFKWDKNN